MYKRYRFHSPLIFCSTQFSLPVQLLQNSIMTSTINVKYVNNTGNTDFEVMVFTKNYSTRTPKTYYVAWHVLRGQTSVTFQYPVHLAVGSTYQEHGLKIISGPFGAELGSSWRITQPKSNSTAVLEPSKQLL